MTLALYAHPFSSYCWKVLIALYEAGTPFDYRHLGSDDGTADEELAAHWPLKRFPLLVDDGEAIPEASIIIEHLDLHHPGPVRMLPADARAALEVRLVDRFFDNYVMTPMQKIVADAMRTVAEHDPFGVAASRAVLDTSYAWLDRRMAGREWAAGAFGLADCAAAPALFYADWAHPIDASLANLRDYRQRLLARPSVARAVDEARPFRGYFPLGAPDRD
ncbi:glutathione S-transferase family protein [Glacieibacterium sp.]|uniref:glutathione S-transferase family protein n=1 Tax=Glacieibacterium sp. TaxID=2860237 RepID=UPI003AFFE1C7